jgi:hypothetical protein
MFVLKTSLYYKGAGLFDHSKILSLENHLPLENNSLNISYNSSARSFFLGKKSK